jgi:hypothetical protein
MYPYPAAAWQVGGARAIPTLAARDGFDLPALLPRFPVRQRRAPTTLYGPA